MRAKALGNRGRRAWPAVAGTDVNALGRWARGSRGTPARVTRSAAASRRAGSASRQVQIALAVEADRLERGVVCVVDRRSELDLVAVARGVRLVDEALGSCPSRAPSGVAMNAVDPQTDVRCAHASERPLRKMVTPVLSEHSRKAPTSMFAAATSVAGPSRTRRPLCGWVQPTVSPLRAGR